ncbi:uncharacterized protein FIBRA_03161 [Fibroporia radiculosa]|uniref:Uncharacterized protein n=1 Tax=Fibroporia radiculosa TaxID=599839 RepID=J4G4D7_9APHY|nr:uncharacterized protein FIBRA_03161 [Fibroporia radiculosa]CCM01113.1 predicted protein [Fibroporia radiculosa]
MPVLASTVERATVGLAFLSQTRSYAANTLPPEPLISLIVLALYLPEGTLHIRAADGVCIAPALRPEAEGGIGVQSFYRDGRQIARTTRTFRGPV